MDEGKSLTWKQSLLPITSIAKAGKAAESPAIQTGSTFRRPAKFGFKKVSRKGCGRPRPAVTQPSQGEKRNANSGSKPREKTGRRWRAPRLRARSRARRLVSKRRLRTQQPEYSGRSLRRNLRMKL